MPKEYATVSVANGMVSRVELTGMPAESKQFEGLKGHPLVTALNKLAELDSHPLTGVVVTGELNPIGANYIVICVRDK